MCNYFFNSLLFWFIPDFNTFSDETFRKRGRNFLKVTLPWLLLEIWRLWSAVLRTYPVCIRLYRVLKSLKDDSVLKLVLSWYNLPVLLAISELVFFMCGLCAHWSALMLCEGSHSYVLFKSSQVFQFKLHESFVSFYKLATCHAVHTQQDTTRQREGTHDVWWPENATSPLAEARMRGQANIPCDMMLVLLQLSFRPVRLRLPFHIWLPQDFVMVFWCEPALVWPAALSFVRPNSHTWHLWFYPVAPDLNCFLYSGLRGSSSFACKQEDRHTCGDGFWDE